MPAQCCASPFYDAASRLGRKGGRTGTSRHCYIPWCAGRHKACSCPSNDLRNPPSASRPSPELARTVGPRGSSWAAQLRTEAAAVLSPRHMQPESAPLMAEARAEPGAPRTVRTAPRAPRSGAQPAVVVDGSDAPEECREAVTLESPLVLPRGPEACLEAVPAESQLVGPMEPRCGTAGCPGAVTVDSRLVLTRRPQAPVGA
mmetsp:Transcript_28435/g.72037  ORF Transcript_28435/g.72037 Transcript_28435/m.72037 type:complete len:202 (+) Transcript_28435:160-765(+)